MPGPLALLALLGVAFASAFVPVVNIEVYLGGLAALRGGAGPAAVAVLAGTAAVGQMAGKTVFYYAGRGAVRLRSRHSARPVKPATAARLARFRSTVEAHPRATPPLLLLSAFVGIPPYAVVAALAGTVRVNLAVFEVTGLVGRAGRFALVLAGVGLLDLSWPG